MRTFSPLKTVNHLADDAGTRVNRVVEIDVGVVAEKGKLVLGAFGEVPDEQRQQRAQHGFFDRDAPG